MFWFLLRFLGRGGRSGFRRGSEMMSPVPSYAKGIVRPAGPGRKGGRRKTPSTKLETRNKSEIPACRPPAGRKAGQTPK